MMRFGLVVVLGLVLVQQSAWTQVQDESESRANCVIREGLIVQGTHDESATATLEESLVFDSFGACLNEAKSRLGKTRVGAFVFSRGRIDRYHRFRKIHDAAAKFTTNRVVLHFTDASTGQKFVARMKVHTEN